MPEVITQAPFIEVPVRPLMRDGILFQRVQRYVSHWPEQDPETADFAVTMEVQVRHYTTNPDGSRGQDASRLIPHKTEYYRTDNTEAIDVTTGQVVLTKGLLTEQEWSQLLADDPRPLARRGNAFARQMHEASTESQASQLEAVMRAADGEPWFRFGEEAIQQG